MRRGRGADVCRQVLVLALGVVIALGVPPVIASAHIEVVPGESASGAIERYGIRVPSEKPSPTVRIEVQFPTSLRVLDFESVYGWQLTTQTDSTGRPIDAIWEGGSIGPNQYAEFGLRAQNPARGTELRWTVIQTYQDGSEVQWIGAPSAEFPAATTHVRDASWLTAIDPVAALAAVVSVVAAVLAGLARWPRLPRDARG